MARKRIAAVSTLKSWEDIDSALRELAEVGLSISDLENEQARKIKEVEDQYSTVSKPLFVRQKRLEADIRMFVESHREDLVDRSRKLTFGTVGYRYAKKVVIPKGKELDVVANCKKRGLTDCINVKESIFRDILLRKGAAVVADVGAHIKETDDFGIDIPKRALVDTTDTE